MGLRIALIASVCLLVAAGSLIQGCSDDKGCSPSCTDRVCGDDGCGGSCGSCETGQTCNLAGQCDACTPDCAGRGCGDDGCGGSCGECDPGHACAPDGTCLVCDPDCAGKQCGDDGCGSSCGDCGQGETCEADGTCTACVPDCTGKQCADDGCGAACGFCLANETCSDQGQCEPCGAACTARPACYGPGERPASVGSSGFEMPDLEAERAAYTRFGWTWAADAEPDFPADAGFQVVDPDIHGDTEGDDLWSYLMMFLRTGEQGYMDRATAWARYFKEDFLACVGGDYANLCYDVDAFGGCHLWGWGLVSWHLVTGDDVALAAAVDLVALLESLYEPDSPFGCLPSNACVNYGTRQVGRHLLLVTRVAEVTGDPRWEILRDKIIDLLLTSSHWDDQRGMYFIGEWSTDQYLGDGAYQNGARLQSPFQVGVLTEGLDHAYRVTGNEEIRTRLVAMADFVDQYGLDPVYDYSASTFGIVDGQIWHSYSSEQPVDFWDPVYTTSLVNTLVRGYRYTCDPHYLDRARHFFERGNKGIYGEPVDRAGPDGVVHHFVDTRFSSATGNFYLDYNKGELQYTYLLFYDVQ